MHESMAFSFMELDANKILCGTDEDLINDLCSVWFYSSMLSHYDWVHDIKTKSLFSCNALSASFPKFVPPGECNGMKLTKRLLKMHSLVSWQCMSPTCKSLYSSVTTTVLLETTRTRILNSSNLPTEMETSLLNLIPPWVLLENLQEAILPSPNLTHE